MFVEVLLQWKINKSIYSDSVLLTLGNQRIVRMHHIATSGLSGSTIFFHIIS